MKRYKKEIIKLTAKEILLSFVDLTMPFYEASRMYRRSVREYIEERSYEKSMFFEKIRYLKRKGYIETFVEGKEKYFELTDKGIGRIKEINFDEIKINRTEKWDGLWRVVVFDISEKKKSNREIFQRKLLQLGFEKIQESVYAYPFECTKEIKLIANYLSVSKSVLIMIADVIQGEEDLIEKFINNKILNKNDLSKK